MLIFQMLKSDGWIREMAGKGMIEPFADRGITPGAISFGLSSYGYDMRLSNEFRVYKNPSREAPGQEDAPLDPKNVEPSLFSLFTGDVCVIPPNSFILGRSLEYFRIPREVLAIVFGKSTYARCGVIVNVTPLEPEWEGFVTISIVNTSCRAVKVYANEGIAQVLFLGGQEACCCSYADKSGKYQAQKGITLSKT
jgi:dCTP deaminase